MRRVRFACAVACLLAAACASPPREEVKLAGIALTEVLDGLATRTGQMLKGLQQGGSAATALDEARSINDGYDDLIYHAWKLPPDGQSELAKRAARQLPTVENLAYMLEGSPLEATLLPEIEAMADKIQLLMSTPYKESP